MMDGLHLGDSEDGERNIDFDYHRDKSHIPNNRMDGFFGNCHHSLDRRTADGTYFSNHQNGSWPRNLTCGSCGMPYSYRHRPTIANRIYSSTSEMDAPLVTSRPIYGDKNMRYDGFHCDERTLYSANRQNRLERSDYSFCDGNSTLERDFAFHGGKEINGLPSRDDHNILGTSTMKHPRSKDSRVSFRDSERRGNEVGNEHFGSFFGDRENGYNAKGRRIWNVRNGDDIYNDSGDDTSFSNKSRSGYPSWMYRHTIDKENSLGRYMDADQCVNSISGDCDTCRYTFPKSREGFRGICRCASGRGETLFRDRSPTFGASNIDTSLGRNRDFSNHSKWITDEFREDYPSVYHDTSVKQDSLARHRDGSFSVNSFLSAHDALCDDIDSSFSEHRVPSTEYDKYPVYNGYSRMMSESDEKGRGSFSIHDNSADRYHIIANGNTVDNREEDKDYHLTGARLYGNEPHDDTGHHPGSENVSSDHYIVNRESANHYNNTHDKTVRVEGSNGTVVATANKKNDDNDEDDDDDDDTNSDDEYDSVYGREDLVVIDKNCCVRSILMAAVVTTGILVITIVASKNKLGDVPQKGAHKSVEQDVWWTDGEWGTHQLVFKDQFLLHDTRDHHPVQVLAIDDVRQIYVIMKMDNDSSKHYNLYLLVNFEEKTETVVIILKSENEYSTDVVEDKVILCQKRRFDREFHGNFAPVSSVMLSSTAETKLNSTRKDLTIDYIGAPLKLGKLMSTVVNSTCERLEAEDKFMWDETDESLACGTTQSEETELESCPQNLCHSFPGIPLSKGQTCHKFRKCNFMMATCSRNYQFGLAEQEEHPYCACRKTAAEDAERLACPRVSDDGGECEIPRRDLLITQKTSPCLCLYNILMIYPFYSQGLDSSEYKDTVTNGDLKWRIKEETVVGPALTFSKCPC